MIWIATIYCGSSVCHGHLVESFDHFRATEASRNQGVCAAAPSNQGTGMQSGENQRVREDAPGDKNRRVPVRKNQ